ncbi:hypothetical protein TTHERM_000974041 (macronuclear) [Tetrahymena thermophila SB210]|uniref:Uncharacterized protein n=1 Tax=Tetrahymena thermophila (strain SB210) TaxID=312017 RepID=W7XJT0_TETTS|nr:hypothetical protein TTHERM_000974041 [Tetrahymena thermophila SB210]EWS75916.1 hypothetical protein TTHERM_000974041 [Tetrahymena thermophila SB210]|eukprot:XP_012651541.1 hypothetical protein TTHERM_000974041 [Tetrahymena thermophila SB210]
MQEMMCLYCKVDANGDKIIISSGNDVQLYSLDMQMIFMSAIQYVLDSNFQSRLFQNLQLKYEVDLLNKQTANTKSQINESSYV